MDLDELVFHPWTVQGPRDVPTFVRGSGSHVIDADAAACECRESRHRL
jgi:taurine---2-oxoglutarate transaminase